jgi:hypothetical protein
MYKARSLHTGNLICYKIKTRHSRKIGVGLIRKEAASDILIKGNLLKMKGFVT